MSMEDKSGEEKKRSLPCASTQDPKRTKVTTVDTTGTETEENEKGSSVHCNDSPPQLSIKLPRIRDLPKTSKPWSNTELPIDVLLLTVKDCEFLSCFFYLDKPFKSYCKDIGYVYLGSLGSGDQNKLKIALIKCSKGSAVPSGSLTVVKNAARILRPKAVFSVGTCIGLNSDRAKRGDVVVSSKLTTPFYRTPVSRNIGNLIRHAADGWTAPLENPDVWEVGVHCDGDVLSHSEAASFGWRHEDIIQKYAEAIAVETEGEGVFAAAHDDEVEWVAVKGISNYGDHNQSPSDGWESFASTMAASLVTNILSDPAIFQGWSHCHQEAPSVALFDVETCRSKLVEHYRRTAKVPTSVWSAICQVELDQIYTRLSWVKKDQTPAGPSQSELRHYIDLFTANKNGVVPKRILVQGQTGIGKSTFVKKMTLDWAELDDLKTGDEQTAADKNVLREDGDSTVVQKQILGSTNLDGQKIADTLVASMQDLKVGKNKLQEGGKSGIFKKLDWDKHFHSRLDELQTIARLKFELVIAINLKEVSKCQSLWEVLSCSHLFPEDEETLIDDLLSYVRNNQEKILLVFDGYDEYRIGSEAEAKFGNRSDSPFYKIFHRDLLRDCTVLITTRSSRADELQGSADKQAEITGFDREDTEAFMRKMLESESQVADLMKFLKENDMEDLARVPLLTLFFCLLWKQVKDKLMELVKTKTKLYQRIIRHILQYSHKKHSPAKVSKVKEENYEEILAEIGKVALEGLLKGNQVFEYDELSENVRGEKSLMVGLLQLSEYGPSLEPMEVVSFIHKSIQEYLAAWYITYRCIPEGNLGEIEEQSCTLEDCIALENVFQFICGLSDIGAVKVFTHFASIRISDPSLDLSITVPNLENDTDVPLSDVTERHEKFSELVLNSFRDVQSKSGLLKHCFHCTGGIILVTKSLSKLMPKMKDLTQVANSWAFLFGRYRNLAVSILYDSLEFLNCLLVPVRMTESSEEFTVGALLTKFLNVGCIRRYFSAVFCCRNGLMQFYITDLELRCELHARCFVGTATISFPSPSANLCSKQPCLRFLTSLLCLDRLNGPVIKDLGASIKNCKHLKSIHLGSSSDYICNLLEQVPNPGACALQIGYGSVWQSTLTTAAATELAGLLPRFHSITTLDLDLCDCPAVTVNKLVVSITPKTLEKLGLRRISLAPGAAAALGRLLPELLSLQKLVLTGANGSNLQAEEMEMIFGGLNKTLPLRELRFSCFNVRGCLAQLTNSLRFFPDLNKLYLEDLSMEEHDFHNVMRSFGLIPNLNTLSLSRNPLGHAVRLIAPQVLENLANLCDLYIFETGGSQKDFNYVQSAFNQARRKLRIHTW